MSNTHFYIPVSEQLVKEFRARRIDHRGHKEWPLRSLDLGSLDFFLWRYVKEQIFLTRPVNFQELQQRFTLMYTTITIRNSGNFKSEI